MHEVLIHATSWMSLENTMLSESSQAQKAPTVGFCFYKKSTINKSLDTESGSEAARA